MKRNVEYIVLKTVRLAKSETFEETLIKIKAENLYHYVLSPSAKVFTLKDAEINNEDDNHGFGLECIHLLVVTPFPSAFNTLFYLLFCVYPLGKKLKEITKRFEQAIVITDEHYLEKSIMETKLFIMESKIMIKENELRIKMLDDLRFKNIQNN